MIVPHTRLAAAPSIWGTNTREWLHVAGQALETGKVGAIFAPDHLRTRDRKPPHTLAWPALLAAAQQAHCATVGPLVARCGVGADENIIHTLETLADAGPTIANLGIGDRIGRRELEQAGLPWPDRNVRIEKLAETAARCLTAGLDVYVASDKDDLHARMPAGAGAHISRERSEHDHGESIGRRTAIAYWAETDRHTFRPLVCGNYTWVSLEQLRGEHCDRFIGRIREAAEELGL